MKKSFLTFTFVSLFTMFLISQNASIEGYVFESGNRGYLNNIKIELFDQHIDTLVASTNSNAEGFFKLEVPLAQKFTLKATHEYFHSTNLSVNSIGLENGAKEFLKIEMKRAPGYLFEITMAEERDDNETPVDAIKSAKIEVFNNTNKEMVLKLDDYEHPDFRVHLKKGNHYTLMIRKEGFLTKRMEAFVDVKGCILCFEGIGEVRPGVTDNLTEHNTFGTLLANVELERHYPGKEIKVNTIYYAPASFELSQEAKLELEKLKIFMTDNPNLIIELGSHTDSRGNQKANMELSKKRAETAVNYILKDGLIGQERLVAKGYGFTKVLNHCEYGVKCSQEEHAVNRRTELKLLGVLNSNNYVEKSLASMKQQEYMDELLAEIQNEGIIEIPKDAELTEDQKKNKRKVKKINEEFEEKSDEIRSSVRETVLDIVDTDREFYDLTEEKREKFDDVGTDQLQEDQQDIEIVQNEVSEDDFVVQRNVSEDEEDDSDWMRGFKIVLMESKEELAKDHEVYTEFKKVNFLRSPLSNKFLYIIGEFQSEMQAEKYISSKLDKKYKQAYVISF